MYHCDPCVKFSVRLVYLQFLSRIMVKIKVFYRSVLFSNSTNPVYKLPTDEIPF